MDSDGTGAVERKVLQVRSLTYHCFDPLRAGGHPQGEIVVSQPRTFLPTTLYLTAEDSPPSLSPSVTPSSLLIVPSP
jgi:hypothetical protein